MRVQGRKHGSAGLRAAGASAPRLMLTLILGIASPVLAQRRPIDPQAAREGVDAAAVTVSETELDASRERPLASTRNAPVQSRNEQYNRARAAEGRLGIRLGNDVGVRVTD